MLTSHRKDARKEIQTQSFTDGGKTETHVMSRGVEGEHFSWSSKVQLKTFLKRFTTTFDS